MYFYTLVSGIRQHLVWSWVWRGKPGLSLSATDAAADGHTGEVISIHHSLLRSDSRGMWQMNGTQPELKRQSMAEKEAREQKRMSLLGRIAKHNYGHQLLKVKQRTERAAGRWQWSGNPLLLCWTVFEDVQTARHLEKWGYTFPDVVYCATICIMTAANATGRLVEKTHWIQKCH